MQLVKDLLHCHCMHVLRSSVHIVDREAHLFNWCMLYNYIERDRVTDLLGDECIVNVSTGIS